jgi:hypothetical protein
MSEKEPARAGRRDARKKKSAPAKNNALFIGSSIVFTFPGTFDASVINVEIVARSISK